MFIVLLCSVLASIKRFLFSLHVTGLKSCELFLHTNLFSNNTTQNVKRDSGPAVRLESILGPIFRFFCFAVKRNVLSWWIWVRSSSGFSKGTRHIRGSCSGCGEAPDSHLFSRLFVFLSLTGTCVCVCVCVCVWVGHVLIKLFLLSKKGFCSTRRENKCCTDIFKKKSMCLRCWF